MFLGAPWSRLGLRISSPVKADIEAALVAKLERHFNERPLSEVHDSGGGYRHPSAEREEARNAHATWS
jgi:hypothetical protein